MWSRDTREIFLAELVSVTGGVFAGFLFGYATGRFELIPGLLILLPGFLEMRGNISGSLSARLSSGLIVAAVKPEFSRNRIVRGNIFAAFALVIAVALVIAGVAYAGSELLFQAGDARIFPIALIAALLSNLIEIPVTIATVFWLFRRHHDPNNVMGPYVTTLGDVVSMAALLIAVIII